jgi:hypothetical protein
MKDTPVQAHVEALNRCNQRGGRMLSLIDLIEAETIDRPLGAYLAAAMRSGASLLVGARPGGAGKTTVMAALLNFLPHRTRIRAVDDRAVLAEAEGNEQYGRTCYLAHEISSATYYYAYIWGNEARRFFSLAAQGHTIASNLHADTLEETRDQLCRENGVAEAHLRAVTLKLYMGIARSGSQGIRRWLNRVYESDGSQNRLLWQNEAGNGFVRSQESRLVSTEQERKYADFLEKLIGQEVRTIEQVRRKLVEADV